MATGTDSVDEPADAEDLLAGLAAVDERTDVPAADEAVAELAGLLAEARRRGLVVSGVRSLDAADVVQAAVGAAAFTTPLVVEGGVTDIAAHLLGTRVAGLPVFLLANVAFVVAMTHALVEWTGRDRVEAWLVAGRVSPRVPAVLAASALVATVLMTLWGRLEGWADPGVVVSRVTVVWTVGALGGALGDSVARDPPPVAATPGLEGVVADEAGAAATRLGDGALVEAVLERFDTLEASVTDEPTRAVVRDLRVRTRAAALGGDGDDPIRRYTTRDVAEAFVGSVLFAVPLLVEDGVFEVAAVLLGGGPGGVPLALLVNTGLVLLTIATVVYWVGPRRVRPVRPLFGVVPRRLVGIAAVSFLTAGALLTLWGRVDGWADPGVVLARTSVVWTVAALGASLGDVLPGESSGPDISGAGGGVGADGGTEDGSTR